MSDSISLRVKAEAKQLFQGLRSVQEATRISEAEEAQAAMESKTARLRTLRLARETEGNHEARRRSGR